jgi:NAD(P)H dehydrogenase (quinone)
MTSHSDSALLVTGAGGQLGGQAVEALLQRGAKRVIAASRDPGKLTALAARGVETRRADFDDPASLAAAFAGVERLLLVSTDTLAEPGRRLAQHRAAVAAAETAGVRHVVYTSAPAPYPTAAGSLIDDHFWTEQALAAARIGGWTFLRNQLYADLLLQSLPHAIASGQLFSATGGAGRNFVTRADCAAAAAGALLGASGKRIHDITGPAPITYDALAALAGEIAGRRVTHIDVSPQDFGAGLAQAGLPPFLVDALVAFDIDASRGHHAITAPGVAELAGRAPTPLRDFLRANAAALRADP